MKKHFVAVLLLFAAFLPGCQQHSAVLPTPASTSPSPPFETVTPQPTASEPVVVEPASTPTPLPAPTLDTTSFIGRTVDDIISEYGSLASIPEEGYGGSRYIFLQSPLNLMLLFNPTVYDEIQGSEIIIAMEGYQGMTPANVGVIPRDITFYDLERMVQESPDAFDSIDINSGGTDDYRGEYQGSISMQFAFVVVSFNWSTSLKDQPCDSFSIFQHLPQSWADGEAQRLMKQCGADFCSEPEIFGNYYTYALKLNGEVLGTVSVDVMRASATLTTPEIERQREETLYN